MVMNLEELKRQFLEDLVRERHRSTKTLENYERYLNRFLAFVKTTNPKRLTADLVRQFRRHLNQLPGTKANGQKSLMTQRTQNYHLIALRTFLKFLQRRGIVPLSPSSVELSKTERCSPDLISVSDTNRLLKAVDQSTLLGKRDRAILELLVASGLRISELCNLLITDIDFARAECLVSVKGDKIRSVSIAKEACMAIKVYLLARPDMGKWLFIRYGHKAHIGEDARVTPKSVQRLLKHYAIKAGIAGRVTPKVIRHSFATGLLIKGIDLRSVQTLLGHASVGTTKFYSQITEPDGRLDNKRHLTKTRK